MRKIKISKKRKQQNCSKNKKKKKSQANLSGLEKAHSQSQQLSMNSFYYNQLNKLNVLWAKQQRKFGSNKQRLSQIGNYTSKKKHNREMWEEKQEYYELKPGKTVEV